MDASLVAYADDLHLRAAAHSQLRLIGRQSEGHIPVRTIDIDGSNSE
jgi:hypothetical protein